MRNLDSILYRNSLLLIELSFCWKILIIVIAGKINWYFVLELLHYSLLPQALGPRQVWDLTSAHAEEPTSRMYKTMFDANCLNAIIQNCSTLQK